LLLIHVFIDFLKLEYYNSFDLFTEEEWLFYFCSIFAKCRKKGDKQNASQGCVDIFIENLLFQALDTNVALTEIRSQLHELTKSVESCQSEVYEVKQVSVDTTN
jgi:hypothetical protein